MKRLMQELGELAGLDIAGASAHAPLPTGVDAAAPVGTLSRGALRWLGRACEGDGRRRTDDERCPAASSEPPAPRPH